MAEPQILKCRFHPQAWVNDNAISVDPEGETDFDAPWPSDQEIPPDDEYETDNLRDHGPQWIQDWSGPFYVEVLNRP